MLIVNPTKRNNFGSNPSSLSHLPTFTPNKQYVELLVQLAKLPENERKNRTDRYLTIKVQLIQLEAKMTSEEIIANTKLAFPKTTKI